MHEPLALVIRADFALVAARALVPLALVLLPPPLLLGLGERLERRQGQPQRPGKV